MEPLPYEEKELAVEAKLEEFKTLPNADVAKDLLAVWAVLRLDYPLPLFLFNPSILINVSPSRKDLQPTLSVFKSCS